MSDVSADAIEAALKSWCDDGNVARVETAPGENIRLVVPVKGKMFPGFVIVLDSGYVCLVPLGLGLTKAAQIDIARVMAAINGRRPYGSFDLTDEKDDVVLRMPAFISDVAQVADIQGDVMSWITSAIADYFSIFASVADRLLSADEAIAKLDMAEDAGKASDEQQD